MFGVQEFMKIGEPLSLIFDLLVRLLLRDVERFGGVALLQVEFLVGIDAQFAGVKFHERQFATVALRMSRRNGSHRTQQTAKGLQTCIGLGRTGLDDARLWRPGRPSLPKALGRSAREHGDQRGAGGSRGVLPGGIVTRVEVAVLNYGSKFGERPLAKPHLPDSAGALGGFRPPRFFAAHAAIDIESPKPLRNGRNHLGFERKAEALALVFTHPETQGGNRPFTLNQDRRGGDPCVSA